MHCTPSGPRRTSLAPHLSCRCCSGAGVMWGDLVWLRSELSVAITFRHSIVLVNVLGAGGDASRQQRARVLIPCTKNAVWS